MTVFRILMYVLVVLHALLVLFTSMAGAFSDGGGIGERLLLVGLHPLGAVGLFLLMFAERLSARLFLVILVLLIVNVVADLVLGALIAQGSVKGDWELALFFAVVPALGIAYALTGPRSRAA